MKTISLLIRRVLLAAIALGLIGQAVAVTLTTTQAGPTTWVYTLTFAPLDNYSIFQGTTTITLSGLTGVTAASGPTSTDFTGSANTINLNWTAQVLNGGTTVVWSHVGGGTGNFSSFQHIFGFSVTAAGASNGTVSLQTSGFSRDLGNPLTGGGFNLDVTGNVSGPSNVAAVILPQFPFGGGWYSALYFTNTNTVPVSFPVTFTADNGAALNVPSVSGSSLTLALAAQGTAILEAPNAGSLSQGYALAVLPIGVIGYGVFRQSVPGIADQEAVVPFSSAGLTSSTLTWDDTSYITAVAIVNPNPISETVSVTASDSTGNIIGTSSLTVAAKSKTAIALRSLPGLAGVVGHRGSAVFAVSSGNVAVLGLRFFGPAFTSIPTLGQ